VQLIAKQKGLSHPAIDAQVALFDQRLETICAIAEEALANPDPWDGLVQFFERGCELQARDRGLKELLGSHTHGGGCVVDARDRLRILVTALFDRAKAAGVVRADAAPFDAPLIHIMIGAVMDRTHDVEPDVWRRYLGLVLDGLRPCAATPLAAPALEHAALEAVMSRPAVRR